MSGGGASGLGADAAAGVGATIGIFTGGGGALPATGAFGGVEIGRAAPSFACATGAGGAPDVTASSTSDVSISSPLSRTDGGALGRSGSISSMPRASSSSTSAVAIARGFGRSSSSCGVDESASAGMGGVIGAAGTAGRGGFDEIRGTRGAGGTLGEESDIGRGGGRDESTAAASTSSISSASSLGCRFGASDFVFAAAPGGGGGLLGSVGTRGRYSGSSSSTGTSMSSSSVPDFAATSGSMSSCVLRSPSAMSSDTSSIGTVGGALEMRRSVGCGSGDGGGGPTEMMRAGLMGSAGALVTLTSALPFTLSLGASSGREISSSGMRNASFAFARRARRAALGSSGSSVVTSISSESGEEGRARSSVTEAPSPRHSRGAWPLCCPFARRI